MADRFGNYGNQDVEAWRRIPNKDEPIMEAEPSFFKKLAMSMANDPTSGASPTALGLVMKNPANVRRLTELIAKYLPEGRSPTAVEHSIAYIKAKYPKLSSLVSSFDPVEKVPPATYVGGEAAGLYHPRDKSVSIQSSLPYGKASGERGAVDTLGHEITHAIQDQRLSSPFTGANPLYERMNTQYGYEKNPLEIQANRGGDTAAYTFLDYLKGLKDQSGGWE